jgi:AcrR family transcriptional regulator
LKLDLVYHTADVETLIATAMLTTTSGANPTTLFNRLKKKKERVADVVGRLEAQHGSTVLDLALRSRFLTITRLGDDRWLLSANLRTVVELAGDDDPFSRSLAESIQDVAPNLNVSSSGSGS